MRRLSLSFLILSLAAIPAVPSLLCADVTVTPVITQQEIKADFDAGKYDKCLQKISMIMASVEHPTGIERSRLLNTKAECLLQGKQLITAADAFVTAATSFTAEKDAKNAATATATADLIKAAQNLQYTPKTGTDKTPISVLDLAARTAALTAMYNDLTAADQAPYKALQGKNSLPPILDFAPKLKELHDFEFASTGSDTTTAAMEKALATQAKTAIDGALTQMTASTDSIAASAATMEAKKQPPAKAGRTGRGAKTTAQQQQPQQPKGLTESDRTTLDGNLANLEKIPPAIKQLIPALDTEATYFKSETADAAALKKKIDALLSKYKSS